MPASAPRASRLAALLAIGALSLTGCDGDGADGDVATVPVETAPGWFTDVSADSGIGFRHTSGAADGRHLPQIMGGGCALFDADGDGDLDAYLTNGAPAWGTTAVGEAARNRLYRQDGDGRFVDVTQESGVGDTGYGMGVAVGDIDNDGDLDLFVTNVGPDRLYRNRGDGTFEDVTAAAGVDVDGWSTSATFVDYDRDGLLDLFVARYVVDDPARRCTDLTGRPDYCTPSIYDAETDVLLHNRGDGTFEDVSAAAGLTVVAARGLGVVAEDLDDDGWVDLYVANDGDPNHLWSNRGDGSFREVAVLQGAAYNLHAIAEAGMGVVAGDLDGDLRPDLFVTHLANESNTLYRNEGPTVGFKDMTGPAGLAATSLPYTGFGVVDLDLDLDGDLDLLVANGAVARHEPRPGVLVPSPWNEYAEQNICYINDGRGRFDLQPLATWGSAVEISRGLARGDIDGDGDGDLLVANVEGAPRLLRNDAPRGGHWLTVRCVDPRLDRDALGAVVFVDAGGRTQRRSITSGFSYLSASQPRAHFGLGPARRVDGIEVRWPDGRRERFDGVEADRLLDLRRGDGDVLD
jgi:hypothetical protein